jgi:NAD-reducing hydrogenase small subunit
MSKKQLATVWLDGCSGCHMSFLDIDDRLFELLDRVDLVYSPLVDLKTFPERVDITLVEGAVSSTDDLEKIKHVRAHTQTLVSLGDCAVTTNVPGMRNLFGTTSVLQRVFFDDEPFQAQVPGRSVPKLLPVVRPVHAVVPVDVYVPGCPPSADTIFNVILQLLDGKVPDLGEQARFGA